MTPSTWLIDRLVPGGDGFTRTEDGRVGFATGALPGDRVRPTKVEEKKGFVRALEWELVEPSADRRAAPCPIADQCGGCDWMALDRRAQLSAKVSVVREALTRTGGFRDLPQELPMVEAGSDLGYRRRLRLHIDQSGRLGLFARASHHLVEVETCLVSAPEINDAIAIVREASRKHPGVLGAFSDVELRAAPGEPRVACHFYPRGDVNEGARQVLAELGTQLMVSVAKEGDGEPQNWPLSCGITLSVPPGVFTQVNWQVNDALIDAVVTGAKKRDIKTFCDLYAGAGNFTLPLLKGGLVGVGVERNPAAVRAAKRTAESSGLDADAIQTGDAARRANAFARARRRFDLVLLDPPRAGASEALRHVRALRPWFIAMCSCDPPTMARDLAKLRGLGYQLDEVIGFDMFPQTHHVETLAWMSATDHPSAP